MAVFLGKWTAADLAAHSVDPVVPPQLSGINAGAYIDNQDNLSVRWSQTMNQGVAVPCNYAINIHDKNKNIIRTTVATSTTSGYLPAFTDITLPGVTPADPQISQRTLCRMRITPPRSGVEQSSIIELNGAYYVYDSYAGPAHWLKSTDLFNWVPTDDIAMIPVGAYHNANGRWFFTVMQNSVRTAMSTTDFVNWTNHGALGMNFIDAVYFVNNVYIIVYNNTFVTTDGTSAVSAVEYLSTGGKITDVQFAEGKTCVLTENGTIYLTSDIQDIIWTTIKFPGFGGLATNSAMHHWVKIQPIDTRLAVFGVVGTSAYCARIGESGWAIEMLDADYAGWDPINNGPVWTELDGVIYLTQGLSTLIDLERRYQSSTDGGVTWTPTAVLPKEINEKLVFKRTVTHNGATYGYYEVQRGTGICYYNDSVDYCVSDQLYISVTGTDKSTGVTYQSPLVPITAQLLLVA